MEVMLRCEQVTWGESVRHFALTNSKSVPLFLPVTGGTGEPPNEDEEAGRAPAEAVRCGLLPSSVPNGNCNPAWRKDRK